MSGALTSPAITSLQGEYMAFLGRFPWDWFCTMTFAYPVHPEAADKKWRVWISKLNRDLYGARWYRKDHTQVFWARALEWQKRSVIHYHALVGDVRDMNRQARRLRWKDEWEFLAGFARIEEIRSDDDVRRYVSKYVTKGGEIELSRSLRFVPRQGSA